MCFFINLADPVEKTKCHLCDEFTFNDTVLYFNLQTMPVQLQTLHVINFYRKRDQEILL